MTNLHDGQSNVVAIRQADTVESTMTGHSEQDGSILGAFIRAQRQMANLSLRQLSAMTQVSNPYLSQIERGLSLPSVRVLRSIAEALNISADLMYEQAGLTVPGGRTENPPTEAAIRSDNRLTEAQRKALLAVLRTYLDANGHVWLLHFGESGDDR